MIDPSAYIGQKVVLGEGVQIGAGARLGDGVELKSGVVIYPDTEIGEGCTVYDHAVLGRPPQGTRAMTRRVRDDLPPLRIGGGCVIGAGVVIYRGTTVGQENLFGDLASVREQCEIGAHCIIARLVTINYGTRLGNRVKVMDATHLTGNMIIEDHVFIGPLVCTTNDNSMDRDPDEEYRGPVLRRGASIGGSASLLPGVEIGEQAIVGSGALVSRNVPPDKVVVGSPARVVRDVRPEWRHREL